MKIEKNKGISWLEVYPLHRMAVMDSITLDLPLKNIADQETIQKNIYKLQKKIYSAVYILKSSNPEFKVKTKKFIGSKKYGIKVCRMK